MLLLIDNYDSFTWNLYQYFCEIGINVLVIRNDAITISEMKTLSFTHLVISPGPCTPDKSGISIDAIRYFAGLVPILGVCLGHQAIAQTYGAQIIRSKKVMHGKTSSIYHTQRGIFHNINCPLVVTRYHSLIVEHSSLPIELEVTAWSTNEDGELEEIMAFRHCDLPIEGIQFHPESILSEQGHKILSNFIKN